MSSQYGELRPTNRWDRLAGLEHPSKFQRVSRLGFVTACRRRSTEVNQTLHDVWPSPGLVHYIFLQGSCPQRNFSRCKIHFASKSCIILYWQRYCKALEQWELAKLCGVVQGMELRNFRSSGATYIPRAAVTFCIGPPHSSLVCLCDKVAVYSLCLTCALVVHFVAR